jgi:hypothetical protein
VQACLGCSFLLLLLLLYWVRALPDRPFESHTRLIGHKLNTTAPHQGFQICLSSSIDALVCLSVNRG